MKNRNLNNGVMENNQQGNMPLVSHYPSRKDWEKACWEKIVISEKLLELLVTSHERSNLVIRAAALDRLTAGKTYNQIAKELWISPQTISSIKKAITGKSYKSHLERSRKEKRENPHSSHIASTKRKSHGIFRKTKYGTVHLP